MKNAVLGTAVALALGLPAIAYGQSSAEISELKSEVQELNAKVAELEASEEKSSWAEKIKVSADLRYRVEYIDREGDSDKRYRHRGRARLNVVGKVNDNTELGVQLRTAGPDPRSGNVTLGGDSASKELGVSRAYAKWQATDAFAFTFGKMKQPWETNPLDYFYDSDLNPEGVVMDFGFGGPFYGHLHYFWIAERSSDDDTTVWGGEFGYAGDLFYASVLYQDYQEMEGRNPCYEGNCNGNTVDESGNLVYDYNMLQVRGGVKIAGFNIFGSWGQNGDAEEDTAYSFGAKYGKASDPGTWEVGAVWHDIEKDAIYGGVVDSDVGAGDTDFDGWVFQGAYAPAKNWKIGLTYIMSSVTKTTNERDYDRIQFDLAWKM
ncbi:MAG: putative porin [Gammaproteobacteria bacterium]